jgi:cytochrome c-type biogenesis protein CcsB
MNYVARLFSWAVVVTAAGYLLWAMAPPQDPAGKPHLQEFAALPVTHEGRVKPVDTLARVSLMIISKRTTWRDEDGNQHSAVEWLLDVMTGRGREKCHSEKVPAFRIDSPKVREILGLEARPGYLYAFDEFAGRADRFSEEIKRASKVPPAQQSEDDKKLVDLASQVVAYHRFSKFETPHKVFRIENDQVRDLLGLEPREGYRYSFDEFVPRMGQLIQQGERIRETDDKNHAVYETRLLQLYGQVRLYVGLAQLEAPTLLLFPPLGPGQEWQSVHEVEESARGDHSALSPAALAVGAVLRDYGDGKVDAFNRDLDDYAKKLETKLPEEAGAARFEVFFNNFAPFYHCAILYVFVFVLACLAWVGWSRPLNQAAFWLAAFLLVFHSWAILARMYIQGRPPVTNLYSSAVFIGWGCVALLLVIEWLYRNGIALVLAAMTGSLTLLIAINILESAEDTMKPLVAVLDTNFWLATHVTCVTLGYTATLVAGCIGIAYIVIGVLTPWLNRKISPTDATALGVATMGLSGLAIGPRLDRTLGKALTQILYGVVCFAMLLSFTGTVLGGIWADQSWGRFWGWDPKENGALLIVIMNALWLHARWAGLLRDRGLAVLAIVGNIVTMWSWFGTNQLRIGLHSYGFNSELVNLCRDTWLLHLGFIVLGLVPLRWWWSFNAAPVAALPPPEPAATKLKRRPRLGHA